MSDSLAQLWEQAPPPLAAASRTDLPPLARRYLEHAIAPAAQLAQAVQLTMRGELRLGSWLPFKARQVVRADRGFVFRARVRRGGLPVSGYDRYLDGAGEMRWRLFGLVPVHSAAGADVSRSAAGRHAAEVWMLPSRLCADDVAWTPLDDQRVRASFLLHGRTFAPTLTVAADGRLLAIELPRWGDPDGGGFRELPFGGRFSAERTFGGFTIPTACRAGWHFGTAQEAEGEFFRAEILAAAFR